MTLVIQVVLGILGLFIFYQWGWILLVPVLWIIILPFVFIHSLFAGRVFFTVFRNSYSGCTAWLREVWVQLVWRL